jgi:lipopolysaccharide transport system ATP-binding protein
MPQPIIKVDHLSKKFMIQHEAGAGGRYTSLRDVISDRVRGIGKKKEQTRAKEEEFWALHDVSFEVEQGDRVGIIGRNGAGKSTLLKVLSQITEPSSGSIRIKGRVASLLEVGTGFHPELTGRENIFLNGAILGMSRAEIKRKFDEIVAFAETEKFLDTPVKRYSSGMYVRLAFAVAAHLEPEILVVDEVLAVGDAQFQKKCLGKMENVSKKEGRTILFVSHNMAAIQMICNKGIYLEHGRLAGSGDMQSQIKNYFSESDDKSSIAGAIIGSLKLINMVISNDRIQSLGEVSISFSFEAISSDNLQSLVLLIYSKEGNRLAIVDYRRELSNRKLHKGQVIKLNTLIYSVPFVEGEYDLGFYYQGDLGIFNVYGIRNINVLTKENHELTTPYDVSVRGLVELDSRFDLQIS